MKKIKNDQYRRVRGGTTKLVNVVSSACGKKVITYQKDGPGQLIRC